MASAGAGAASDGPLFGAKLARRAPSAPPAAPAAAAAARRCPVGCCCDWSPSALARWAARLDRGTTIVSATNGKTTTAGMIAAALGADGRRPGPQPGRLEHDLGSRDGAARAAGPRGPASRSTRPGSPRVAAQLDPRLIVLGNLFRDQLDRYGEMEALGRGLGEDRSRSGPAAPASCSTPTTRRSPTSAATRPAQPRAGVTYFGIEDPSQALPELQHAFDAKHCRRCGHPYTYERAFVGHLGHYSCPGCGAQRPAAAGRGDRDRAAGHGRARGQRCAPRTASCDSSCRCPASTTSTTRSRRSPRRSSSASRRSGSPPPWRRCGPPSAGSRRSRSTGRRLSILLIKNPAGANEVLRTLRARGGRRGPRPLDRAQRPDRRRSRRLLDLGRRLRAARGRRAPRRLRRHPGGGDGAAAEVRGLADGGDRGRAGDRALARSGARAARATASSPSPPTRRCSSCASCSPTAASRRSSGG